MRLKNSFKKSFKGDIDVDIRLSGLLLNLN